MSNRYQKYFYTVLYLDDYFPERKYDNTTPPEPSKMELPEIKKYEITKETNTENVKWLEKNVLYVRHNLKLPLTLEMWNNEDKPIFYCPILKEGIDSISIGQVVIETPRSITLHFNEDNLPPGDNEKYILSIKTLPSFDTKSTRSTPVNDVSILKKSLDEIVSVKPFGMAIVFRRHSLDALFDLIVDFDESYWHSLADGSDLKYLTRKSLFQTCRFTCKYTENIQDVLDLIDTSQYEIKFSWENDLRN